MFLLNKNFEVQKKLIKAFQLKKQKKYFYLPVSVLPVSRQSKKTQFLCQEMLNIIICFQMIISILLDFLWNTFYLHIFCTINLLGNVTQFMLYIFVNLCKLLLSDIH